MIRTIALLIATGCLLTACNTVSGIGRDIRAGGEKIEEAAKKK